MAKKKIRKISILFLPALIFFIAGFFAFANLNCYSGIASAVDNGGAFYVGNGSTFTLDSSKTISGFSSSSAGGGFYIASGGIMNITSGGVFKNSTTSSSGCGGGIYNAGTLNINGGIISENTSNSGGGIYSTGTIIMTDGTISGNNKSGSKSGDAVYLNGGTFTMSGGTISGNGGSTGQGSGCVYIGGNAVFTMSGGAIAQNKNMVSCVYVALGDFTLNGGTLDSIGGYGVFVNSGSTFTMEGGFISSSSSAVYSMGSVVLKDGTVNGNIECTQMNFYSDVNILGSVRLFSQSGTICMEDYDGTTPSLNINISNSSRDVGPVVTFVGSSTAPDMSKIKISGYDTNNYELKTVKDADGNWTISLLKIVKVSFNPNGGSCSVSSIKYNPGDTYGTLPTATKSGWIFAGWSRNFFDARNDVLELSDCKRVGTTFTMNTGSNNTSEANMTFQVQRYLNDSYVGDAYTSYSAGKIHFTFTKASTFNQLRVKLNGNVEDGSFLIDISNLSDGDYVFQANITTLALNEMVVKDIMIEQNVTNSVTTYVNSVVSSSDNIDSEYGYTLFARWNGYSIPTDWKTQVASSTYMTTTITPANITSIKFVSSVPSGYTLIGTLSTGLPVCKASSTNDIAFVAGKVNAPASSDQLFYYLTNLTSIDFSVFDTSDVTSMSNMFNNCSALTSLDISNFDTSKVTSMYQMFYGCSGFTSLDISNFDTSKVTNMYNMFGSCSALTSLDLSNFNTSKITDMSSIFSRCSGLTSLNLSNFNTSNVIYMSNMFNNCSGLTSLNLSNFDTSNVKYMSYMFYGCSGLTSLNVSNFDTSKVTDMSYMFYGCSGLTSLNLSNFNTSNVTNMGYVFYKCSALTSLDVSGFDTSKITNMYHMFDSCSGLTSLNVSNFDTSKVTDMSSMFSGCSGLISLDISNFNTSNVTYMISMFSGCSGLTSLDISNFDTSKVTSMKSMFYGCSGFTSLDISNFNTSKVTSMYQMFYGCSGFTSLDLNNFNTSKVTSMYQMFRGCLGLTSLDLSNFDTSNVTSMINMFYNCSGLTSLDLSSFNMSKVTSSSDMFNFGATNKIQTLKTPYNNTSALAITTGLTLYNAETGEVVTSVPANNSSSLTLVHNHNYTSSSTYVNDGASGHHVQTTQTCSECSHQTVTNGAKQSHSTTKSTIYSITSTAHKAQTTTKCRYCSYSNTMTGLAESHTYSNGTCSVCGYAQGMLFLPNKKQETLEEQDVIFEKEKQEQNFFVLKFVA